MFLTAAVMCILGQIIEQKETRDITFMATILDNSILDDLDN